MEKIPAITHLKLLQKERVLQLSFDNGEQFEVTCAYLRAHSPSAEMKRAEQSSVENVNVVSIEPVGNYAVKFIFDDGHATGIYHWELLYQLGKACTKSQPGT